MAAPSPMTSAMGGVPASNFQGMSLAVQPSRRTSRIISPPPRKAGMASSSSSRAHSTPIPVGPSILWPVKPKKSQPSSATSVGRCGDVLGAVDQDEGAGGVGGVGELADRGDGAQHVGHGGEAEELGPVEQPVEIGQVEGVVVGHGDEAQLDAALLVQDQPRHQVGVVLDLGEHAPRRRPPGWPGPSE